MRYLIMALGALLILGCGGSGDPVQPDDDPMTGRFEAIKSDSHGGSFEGYFRFRFTKESNHYWLEFVEESPAPGFASRYEMIANPDSGHVDVIIAYKSKETIKDRLDRSHNRIEFFKWITTPPLALELCDLDTKGNLIYAHYKVYSY